MMNRIKNLKQFWLILAVLLSLFSLDWLYLRFVRSLLAYSIQNTINHYMNLLLVITGFAWSQAIKTAMGRVRPSYVVKILAPLAYKLKGEEKIGYKIIATYDLQNPRVDEMDVYEELAILQKNKEPEAILIRKLTPPKQPDRYKMKTPEW